MRQPDVTPNTNKMNGRNFICAIGAVHDAEKWRHSLQQSAVRSSGITFLQCPLSDGLNRFSQPLLSLIISRLEACIKTFAIRFGQAQERGCTVDAADTKGLRARSHLSFLAFTPPDAHWKTSEPVRRRCKKNAEQRKMVKQAYLAERKPPSARDSCRRRPGTRTAGGISALKTA